MKFSARHQPALCRHQRTNPTRNLRAMAIALTCAFGMTPYQGAAQEIVINHYTHKGVRDRQR